MPIEIIDFSKILNGEEQYGHIRQLSLLIELFYKAFPLGREVGDRSR